MLSPQLLALLLGQENPAGVPPGPRLLSQQPAPFQDEWNEPKPWSTLPPRPLPTPPAQPKVEPVDIQLPEGQFGSPAMGESPSYPAAKATPAEAVPAPAPTQGLDIEGKLQRLRALREAAEGFGGIGTSIVNAAKARAGMITGAGQQETKPYIAGGIREDIEEAGDQLTKDEAGAYQAMGIQVPEGFKRSRLQGLLPLLSAKIAAGGRMAIEVKREGALSDRLERSTKAQAEIGRLHDEARVKAAGISASAMAERAGERNKEIASRQLVSQQNIERRGIESDKAINQYKAKIRVAKTIEKLLTEAGDNPAAVRAAMAQAQKVLAGETGVMTQRDIEAYEGAYGIPGILFKSERAVTGNFTPLQRERVKQVARIMAEDAELALNDIATSRIGSFYETNKEQLGKAGKDKTNVEGMYRGLLRAPESVGTIDVVWPDTGEVKTIKDTPEARAAAKKAGYKLPGE